MDVKQQLSDQSTVPKKHCLVGFSAIDEGAVAEECVKIYLVSSKEEVGAPDSFCIDPLDLNQFFEEDGKIYGYQELKITIWVSTISFHAYADIAYKSTSDGGNGVTDLKLALQKIFADTLVENKDEFLQTFLTEGHYISSILSSGELLEHKPTNCNGNDSNVEAGSSAVEAVHMTLSKANAGILYSRLVPLALLLVDGSSLIDVTDPQWKIYVLAQMKIDEQEETHYKVLCFGAVYRSYHYPDTSRLLRSQILVLPPYQDKGYGQDLLNLLNNVAISENFYDVRVEAPLEYFQQVRTSVDTTLLLHLDSIQHAVNSVAARLKEDSLSKKTHSSTTFRPPSSIVEDARKSLKINKNQFLQRDPGSNDASLGTIVVAATFEQGRGIIMVADTKVTNSVEPNQIFNKIHIRGHKGLGGSGNKKDFQQIIDLFMSIPKKKKLQHVRGTILSYLKRGCRQEKPLGVTLLVCGMDRSCAAQIYSYSYDSVANTFKEVEEVYAAIGCGSRFAKSVLEQLDRYSIREEVAELTQEAVIEAIFRQPGSCGGPVDSCTIEYKESQLTRPMLDLVNVRDLVEVRAASSKKGKRKSRY